MRKKRLSKIGFNTKLMLDVVAASLIVQKAPALLDEIIAIPESLKSFAGIGLGYLTGSLLNRPDLANASIALGAVELVSPMIDDLLGSATQVLPPVGGTKVVQSSAVAKIKPSVADYLTLNDYVTLSESQSNEMYRNSY